MGDVYAGVCAFWFGGGLCVCVCTVIFVWSVLGDFFFVCVRVCLYVCAFVFLYVCLFVCVCMNFFFYYVCMYVCMCVAVYV